MYTYNTRFLQINNTFMVAKIFHSYDKPFVLLYFQYTTAMQRERENLPECFKHSYISGQTTAQK